MGAAIQFFLGLGGAHGFCEFSQIAFWQSHALTYFLVTATLIALFAPNTQIPRRQIHTITLKTHPTTQPEIISQGLLRHGGRL